jgi:hypothetical protein
MDLKILDKIHVKIMNKFNVITVENTSIKKKLLIMFWLIFFSLKANFLKE